MRSYLKKKIIFDVPACNKKMLNRILDVSSINNSRATSCLQTQINSFVQYVLKNVTGSEKRFAKLI